MIIFFEKSGEPFVGGADKGANQRGSLTKKKEATMTAPRELYGTEAPQTHWETAAYSCAALSANVVTAHLAHPWGLLIEELENCMRGQRLCWLEELRTQAKCDQINHRLDALTSEFATTKLLSLRVKNKRWREKEARASGEFTLYFGAMRPFELIRLALESQIPLMESWPQKLLQENSPELQRYSIKFSEILEEGRAALKERDDARARTALHRVREIYSLVERLNKQRLSTYTELLQIAQKEGEAKTWPDSFFARQSQAPSNAVRERRNTQSQEERPATLHS
jgi:hypothetical protein